MSYVWFAHLRIRACDTVGRGNRDDSEGEKPTILGRSRYFCEKICRKKIKLDPFLKHQTQTLLVAAIPMKSFNWTELTNLQSRGRKLRQHLIFGHRYNIAESG